METREVFRQRINQAEKKAPGYTKKWETLHHTLTNIGGHDVVHHFGPEPDIDYLLEYGKQPLNLPVVLEKMGQNQCHENSKDLARQMNLARGKNIHNKEMEPGLTLWMTGYALSDDGLWRQHSWCLDTQENQIIETTESRIAYFGISIGI